MTGNFAVGRLEYAAVITAHIIAFAIRCIEDTIHIRSKKMVTIAETYKGGL